MKLILLLGLVGAAFGLDGITMPGPHPFSDAAITRINRMQNFWTAGKNFNVSDFQRVVTMLGVKEGGKKLPVLTRQVPNSIPTHFDSRTKWPNCPTIRQIRDQGACGSCWAFGTVEAISDRICISSNGKQTPQISAEDLNSCSGLGGCDGGYPSEAWQWYVSNGIVTGGLYNSHVGCQPYTIRSCDHHEPGPFKPCGNDSPTPKCKSTCEAGYNVPFDKDQHFGSSAYSVVGMVQLIQAEILQHGPVTATFTVFADFPTYRSGVYVQTSDDQLGGHAVKILGWGVEKGVDYWLVANSWNPSWGDKGYFKIRRGTDECGIEGDIVAGEPKL